MKPPDLQLALLLADGAEPTANKCVAELQTPAFSRVLLSASAALRLFHARRVPAKDGELRNACNPPTSSPTADLHLIHSSSPLNSDFCTLGLFFRACKRVHAEVSVKRRRSRQRFCLDGHKQAISEKLRSCSDAAAASAVRA